MSNRNLRVVENYDEFAEAVEPLDFDVEDFVSYMTDLVMEIYWINIESVWGPIGFKWTQLQDSENLEDYANFNNYGYFINAGISINHLPAVPDGHRINRFDSGMFTNLPIPSRSLIIDGKFVNLRLIETSSIYELYIDTTKKKMPSLKYFLCSSNPTLNFINGGLDNIDVFSGGATIIISEDNPYFKENKSLNLSPETELYPVEDKGTLKTQITRLYIINQSDEEGSLGLVFSDVTSNLNNVFPSNTNTVYGITPKTENNYFVGTLYFHNLRVNGYGIALTSISTYLPGNDPNIPPLKIKRDFSLYDEADKFSFPKRATPWAQTIDEEFIVPPTTPILRNFKYDRIFYSSQRGYDITSSEMAMLDKTLCNLYSFSTFVIQDGSTIDLTLDCSEFTGNLTLFEGAFIVEENPQYSVYDINPNIILNNVDCDTLSIGSSTYELKYGERSQNLIFPLINGQCNTLNASIKLMQVSIGYVYLHPDQPIIKVNKSNFGVYANDKLSKVIVEADYNNPTFFNGPKIIKNPNITEDYEDGLIVWNPYRIINIPDNYLEVWNTDRPNDRATGSGAGLTTRYINPGGYLQYTYVYKSPTIFSADTGYIDWEAIYDGVTFVKYFKHVNTQIFNFVNNDFDRYMSNIRCFMTHVAAGACGGTESSKAIFKIDAIYYNQLTEDERRAFLNLKPNCIEFDVVYT